MADHQKVKSGLEISVEIADLLELAPQWRHGIKYRGRIIHEVNDIIQGRSDKTVEDLLNGLRERCRGWYSDEIERFDKEIKAFQTQKAALSTPSPVHGKDGRNIRARTEDPHPSMRTIDQRQYDRAVQEGFPPDFFQGSYFDRVMIYYLPDGTSCEGTVFSGCHFQVCRLVNVELWDSSLYDCDFQSCYMDGVLFLDSALANTHFHDCDILSVGFIRSKLRHCSIVDCAIEKRLNLSGSVLNGSFFRCVSLCQGGTVKGLDTATITCGGATAEEIKQLRRSIFKALDVPQPTIKKKKLPSPER